MGARSRYAPVPMPNATPHLSVCMIARDEAERIARALESVRTVADEMIVSDTGSRDATPEIARALGADVASTPWSDDFAAARNHAIGRARGTWILWLDADEEVLPESREELVAAVARIDAAGFYLLRLDLVDAARPDVFTEMWQLRLFRREPGLRFEGRCHPRFVPPLEEVAQRSGRRVFESGIRLRHTGYVEGLRRTKLERAARLLALELAERPGQLYYEVEYGRTLLQLGEPRGHAVLADAARRVDVDPGPLRAAAGSGILLLEHALGAATAQAGFPLAPARAEALAAEIFPHCVPLLWLRARRAAERGDHRSAAALLEAVRELDRSGSYDRTLSFDPRMLRESALLNLGVEYVQLGRVRDARRCFGALLGNPEFADRAARNLRLLGDRI